MKKLTVILGALVLALVLSPLAHALPDVGATDAVVDSVRLVADTTTNTLSAVVDHVWSVVNSLVDGFKNVAQR